MVVGEITNTKLHTKGTWLSKVERVEIKNVILPQQLQRSMAAEAEASREARAKVIAAEGEANAADSLGLGL